MTNNVTKGSGSASRSSAQVTAVIEAVRTHGIQRLSGLLKTMFDGLSSTLFDLAKNLPEAEQQKVLDTLPVVRVMRAEVEGRFASSLLTAFSALLKAESAKTADGQDTIDYSALNLIDHEEMDVTVSIDTIVARSRLDCASSLGLLRKRFSNLLPKVEMTDRSLPLDPGAVVGAFKDGLLLMTDIQVQERLLILKVFQVQVLSVLGEILDEANRLMIDAGVLPDLKLANTPAQARSKSRRKKQPMRMTIQARLTRVRRNRHLLICRRCSRI